MLETCVFKIHIVFTVAPITYLHVNANTIFKCCPHNVHEALNSSMSSRLSMGPSEGRYLVSI